MLIHILQLRQSVMVHMQEGRCNTICSKLSTNRERTTLNNKEAVRLCRGLHGAGSYEHYSYVVNGNTLQSGRSRQTLFRLLLLSCFSIWTVHLE